MADLLFLAHRLPFPPDRGDKIRSFNLLRHLCGRGKVHLACFADDAAEAARLPELRKALGPNLGEAWVEVRRPKRIAAVAALLAGRPLSVAMFGSRGLGGFVRRLLRGGAVESIFAFSGQMAQFVPAEWDGRFIMDFVDVDSAKFAEYGRGGSFPFGALYRREGRSLLAYERQVATRADISLFVSEAEAALFRAEAGGGDVRALRNGIDLDFYDPAAAFAPLSADARGSGPLIVFTGQMDYRPNADAVTSFVHEAMPAVRRERPDARFAIVGRRPSAAVQRLGGVNGALVTGEIADVRSWLAAADVVVAPLAIARGVQNKVLEAMAMARPIVVSSQALEGIDAAPGKELVLADGSAAQAKAVLSLLADPAKASKLGKAARRRVERDYSWSSALGPLDVMLSRGRLTA